MCSRLALILFSFLFCANFFVSISPARAQAPAPAPKTPTNSGTISNFGNILREGIVPCGHKDAVDGKRPDDTCTITDMFVAVARITNFLLGFSGIFIIYKIVSAGFLMARSNGSEQDITEAKGAMTNAFLGLLLIFIAFILVEAILYSILRIKGPTDILSNPANYIQNK